MSSLVGVAEGGEASARALGLSSMEIKPIGRGADKRQLDRQNRQIIDHLRLNGGWLDTALQVVIEDLEEGATNEELERAERVRGPLEYAVKCGLPVLILHHFGARTGTERVNPVAYLKDQENYVIFATHGGRPSNPRWYVNLIQRPEVMIEVAGRDGLQVVAVRARLADRSERDRLWSAQTAIFSPFIEYQERTTRQVPVVVLEPEIAYGATHPR